MSRAAQLAAIDGGIHITKPAIPYGYMDRSAMNKLLGIPQGECPSWALTMSESLGYGKRAMSGRQSRTADAR